MINKDKLRTSHEPFMARQSIEMGKCDFPISHNVRCTKHLILATNPCATRLFTSYKSLKILLIFLLSLIFSPFISADTCPTVRDIQERKVPEAYEWTVNYELALGDLLSVTQLYAVSIENHGEFVSCKYESPNREVRLDGISKAEKCLIMVESGDWFTMDSGGIICQEDELSKCQYKYECN